MKEGTFYVKIKAIVKKADDYKSPDLIKKAKYSLSIVPFKATKEISCLGRKVSSKDFISKLSNTLSEQISKSKKFNLVDRDNLDAYADELALITNNTAHESNQSRLKNVSSADYILVGKIDSFVTTKTTQNVPMTGESYSNSRATSQVSYKLIETATMEVITSATVDERLKKDGSFNSCANLENEISKKIGLKISNEILTELFPGYEPKKKVQESKAKKHISQNQKAHKKETVKLPFD